MNWFRSEMCVTFSLQLSVAFSILRYDLHFIKIEFFFCHHRHRYFECIEVRRRKQRDWFDSQKCFFNRDLWHTPASIVEAAKRLQFGWLNALSTKRGHKPSEFFQQLFSFFPPRLSSTIVSWLENFSVPDDHGDGWRRRRRSAIACCHEEVHKKGDRRRGDESQVTQTSRRTMEKEFLKSLVIGGNEIDVNSQVARRAFRGT